MKRDEVPTVVCNRFSVMIAAEVRLIFGEQVLIDGEVNYVTAQQLSRENAKLLAELILRLLKEQETKDEAAKGA